MFPTIRTSQCGYGIPPVKASLVAAVPSFEFLTTKLWSLPAGTYWTVGLGNLLFSMMKVDLNLMDTQLFVLLFLALDTGSKVGPQRLQPLRILRRPSHIHPRKPRQHEDKRED